MTFEYAPALESRSVVDIASSYGLFIDGRFVDGEGGRPFKTISPATEEVLAEVVEASDADVDSAVRAARRAYERPGRRCRAASAPSTCTGSPASSAERSRELAVLESLDNGKPIRESRDTDIPLVAALLLLLRRLGGQAGVRRVRR